ncbi:MULTISPECIES: hypothetical protein [unclassified Fusibacter]|uniref:hypothetical protein n=1 Tax=unclassified Fusibacter TaxID=2624464 RepID=UPI0010135A19|nr:MULTISPECIES: hypothetical protein [unclassified Fusibacter]MCK8059729.1 hypothetical protein [Fusibacter sp. A2]NPE21530.1 hypothetical protein [Fusibacter sp. A1]RXV61940.1 hypothetical protein DWB64_06785 [Fusibacter sp. A1]
MADSKKLREHILKSGLKYKYIAQKLGITSAGLKLKIDNVNEFKINEVNMLCIILGIDDLNIKEDIFFDSVLNSIQHKW